jgi:hypothetical protein
MKNEIIKAIHDIDQSVEVIARELAHRKTKKLDNPECSGDL